MDHFCLAKKCERDIKRKKPVRQGRGRCQRLKRFWRVVQISGGEYYCEKGGKHPWTHLFRMRKLLLKENLKFIFVFSFNVICVYVPFAMRIDFVSAHQFSIVFRYFRLMHLKPIHFWIDGIRIFCQEFQTKFYTVIYPYRQCPAPRYTERQHNDVGHRYIISDIMYSRFW